MVIQIKLLDFVVVVVVVVVLSRDTAPKLYHAGR